MVKAGTGKDRRSMFENIGVRSCSFHQPPQLGSDENAQPLTNAAESILEWIRNVTDTFGMVTFLSRAFRDSLLTERVKL
jgi:hypothetical protein